MSTSAGRIVDSFFANRKSRFVAIVISVGAGVNVKLVGMVVDVVGVTFDVFGVVVVVVVVFNVVVVVVVVDVKLVTGSVDMGGRAIVLFSPPFFLHDDF